MKALILLMVLGTAGAQQVAAPLAARVQEAVQRDGNGHSPTDEEILAIGNPSVVSTAEDVGAALPFLLTALESSDDPLRTFALTALVGLQQAPVAVEGVPANPNAPPVFKADVAAVLAPAVGKIAGHLTEDSRADGLLAATILGGFSPNPPPALYPPLQAYLKRDKAVDSVGLAVFNDLLQVGPLSEETAAGLGKYLKRSDQTADTRASLVEAIASHANQNQALNKAVLEYLGSDDSSLRARVILSLPALDLSPEVYADTKSRVQTMAENSGENLQVINAAKAVAPCWTQVKMLTGCPVYQ